MLTLFDAIIITIYIVLCAIITILIIKNDYYKKCNTFFGRILSSVNQQNGGAPCYTLYKVSRLNISVNDFECILA
jgi:hypothetical protein